MLEPEIQSLFSRSNVFLTRAPDNKATSNAPRTTDGVAEEKTPACHFFVPLCNNALKLRLRMLFPQDSFVFSNVVSVCTQLLSLYVTLLLIRI